jgi:hypothetical protein
MKLKSKNPFRKRGVEGLEIIGVLDVPSFSIYIDVFYGILKPNKPGVFPGLERSETEKGI